MSNMIVIEAPDQLVAIDPLDVSAICLENQINSWKLYLDRRGRPANYGTIKVIFSDKETAEAAFHKAVDEWNAARARQMERPLDTRPQIHFNEIEVRKGDGGIDLFFRKDGTLLRNGFVKGELSFDSGGSLLIEGFDGFAEMRQQ